MRKACALKVQYGPDGKLAGFIEYMPAEMAWRPVKADNFLFIHCIVVGSKKDRKNGVGSTLVQSCIRDADKNGFHGVVVMASDGPWLADKRLFLHNGFEKIAKKGRFDLLAYKGHSAPNPTFVDWEKELPAYKGWHLVYADQCPWHPKSVAALTKTAEAFDIDLQVKKLETPEDAKHSPTGFGVFGLIKDGKILEDHYLSATRFKNILKKELHL